MSPELRKLCHYGTNPVTITTKLRNFQLFILNVKKFKNFSPLPIFAGFAKHAARQEPVSTTILPTAGWLSIELQTGLNDAHANGGLILE